MIEVNNLTKRKVPEVLLKKATERVLRGEFTLNERSESKGKIKQKDVSIAIVGPKKSRELNKRYRNKNKAANVLSFPAGNDRIPSDLSRSREPRPSWRGAESREVEGYLGEIVLCPAEIQKDAKKYGMMFEQALLWMLVHGILHLTGYDHKTDEQAVRMEKKEQHYLSHI